MKDIRKWVFSIFMFCIAMLLSVAAATPYNIGKLILFISAVIIIGGLAISLSISVWSKRNRKSSFIKSFKLSFGLSALLFIFGYLFTALQPVIFK